MEIKKQQYEFIYRQIYGLALQYDFIKNEVAIVNTHYTLFTAFPCPFLAKPHPCLFILLILTYVQAKT